MYEELQIIIVLLKPIYTQKLKEKLHLLAWIQVAHQLSAPLNQLIKKSVKK